MRTVPGYPLWIGTARDARDVRRVLDAGIEAVVDLAVEEPPAVLTRELAYLRLPLIDGGGNPPWLLTAAGTVLAVLVRQRVPTLVACGAGLSRSPAVVALALGFVTGRPAAELLTEVQAGTASDVHPALWNDVLSTVH
jgi:protein-tyrosine phosphatase